MKNSIINTFAKIVSAGLTVALTLLVYRKFGAEVAGKFGIAISIYLAIFALLCSGIPYLIAGASNETELRSAHGFLLILTGGALLASPFFVIAYLGKFDQVIFAILLLCTAKLCDSAIEFSYAVNRSRDDYKTILYQTLIKGALVLMVFLATLFYFDSLLLFASIILGMSLLHMAFALSSLGERLALSLTFKKPSIARKLAVLNAAGFLAVLATVLPRFIVENEMGYAAAGAFVALSQVYIALCTLGATIVQVSGLSRLNRQKFNHAVMETKNTFRVLLTAFAVVGVATILAPILQVVLLGEKIEGGNILLSLTSMAAVFLIYRDALTYRAAQREKNSVLIKINLLTLSVLCVVGAFLVPAVGIAGIGAAILGAAVLSSLMLWASLLKDDRKLKV